MDLNPAEFESHHGVEGLNHDQKTIYLILLLRRIKKLARNKQKISKKVQGVGFEPTNL